MPITLIEQNPTFDKKVEGQQKLAIAELFCNTIQGEGVYTGVCATFVRLQGCTLKCVWCDTLDVWPHGNEYSFKEIFEMFESVDDLIDRFKNHSQHLVLTGGSPLLQQERLVSFVNQFMNRYSFKPFIQVENECVLFPTIDFELLVDCWNNSPKLTNSGMKERARLKPDVIQHMAKKRNSWFKFVVNGQEDWSEIEANFLATGLIYRSQVILMPQGDTQEKLNLNRERVADLAIREDVRFSDRLHVTIWNKKTGV